MSTLVVVSQVRVYLMGKKKKPTHKDYIDLKDDRESLLRAYAHNYEEGNFNPSVRKIAKDAGINIQTVKKIRDNLQFNPDTSPQRFFIPTAIQKLQEIIINKSGKETTGDIISACRTFFDAFKIDRADITQSNTFSVNVTVSESKAIDDAVEIRHFEEEKKDE